MVKVEKLNNSVKFANLVGGEFFQFNDTVFMKLTDKRNTLLSVCLSGDRKSQLAELSNDLEVTPLTLVSELQLQEKK